MYNGFDTECYINTGELKIIGVENLGVFYIPKSTTPIYFIFDLMKQNKMNKFCCYNLDYDIGALIKHIFPQYLYKKLNLGLQVKYKQVSFRYLKGKKCVITYKNFRIYFYDCFQFYKTSLKKSSKRFLNLNKGDFNIIKMYEGVLEKNLLSALKYCYTDSILCGKLFRLIIEKIENAGIKNPEPISQGYIAYQYFRNELLKIPNVPLNNEFMKAYKGGRFEIFKRGYFKEAYYYDICSAYPYAISKIKSLENCETIINDFYLKEADYSVFKCDVSIPFNIIIGPIGIKINEKTYYPTGFLKDIWIDKNDYDCLKLCKATINIKIAYHLICKNETIFKKKVLEIYQNKLKFPKDNEIWKILLNSIYGKLLQNVKHYIRKNESKFASSIADVFYDKNSGELFFKFDNEGRALNYVFASYITSHTRKQIYFDIFKYQKNIIAIFTDGIITDKKLPLKISSKLGCYKFKKITNLYMVGTGIYFYNCEGVRHSLFRGFHVKDANKILKKIIKSKRSIVNFEINERIGLGKAIAQNNLTDFNLIMPVIKKLDLNFDVKRIWNFKIKKGQDLRKISSSIPIPII